MFGDWINNLDSLNEQFKNAKPFEFVQINGFFSEEVANKLYNEFPDPLGASQWKHYDNPLEQKYALNNFEGLPEYKSVLDALQSNDVITKMRSITGIENLESDPHLHGAGIHAYPHNGKLDVHLDYSIHPVSGKERRVNLIVYLNKDWSNDYRGHLQLWNSDMSECKSIIVPSFNSAVLFRTSDISYHGLPEPLRCPPGTYRKSLAIYYVSPARPEAPLRLKAEFFPLPSQQVDERLQKLYDIRKQRLLTKEDLWSTWREDGNGHW